MTRLGAQYSAQYKAAEQMTAKCWRWRPRWNRLTSSTSCFGSSACLQCSSSVLCKTAYCLESPQDRLGGTHAKGAGHPDKLKIGNKIEDKIGKIQNKRFVENFKNTQKFDDDVIIVTSSVHRT